MTRNLIFLIIGALACTFGAIQILAQKQLRLVDRELSKVAPEYWTLTWESVDVASQHTEAEAKEYNEHEIPKVLIPDNVRSLLRFREFVIIPSLRTDITATLRTAQKYLAFAGIEVAGISTDHTDFDETHTQDILNQRLRKFRFDRPGCNLDYFALKDRIETLVQEKKVHESLNCLEQASLALLNTLQSPSGTLTDPFTLFRESVKGKHRKDFIPADKIKILKDIGEKVEAKYDKFYASTEGKESRKILSGLAGTKRAEEITRWFYNTLGFNLEPITLEAHPRDNLNFSGLQIAISPPKDCHLLITHLMTQIEDFKKDYLRTMIHEFGHGIAFCSMADNLLWTYRGDSEDSWYDEGMADLFTLLFFEQATIKQVPDKKVASLAKLGPFELRLNIAARYGLSSSLTTTQYHMLVFSDPKRTFPDVSKELLTDWPNYYFNKRLNKKVSDQLIPLFFSIREMEGLINYPFLPLAYVKNPLVITAIASKYFHDGVAQWDEIERLGDDLRKMFRYGASKSAYDLVKTLGVASYDTDEMIRGYKTYFGI